MSEFDAQDGRALPDGPATEASRLASDDDLASGLGGLAALVSGSLDLADLLARVAGFATQAIPGVDGAGVTLLVRGNTNSRPIEAWGATAEFVREIDRIQYDVLDEGPCITCIDTGRPTVSGSLGSDQRWPRFGGRVARLGVHSALSLPLLLPDGAIGALNTYAHARDAFAEHAVTLAQQFTGPAAVAVRNAQHLAAINVKAEQLQTALVSRAVIDQAIGILRSRSGGSSDEAFARLRDISQSENVKLAVVAQRLVDEAVRRAHARHSSADREE